MTSLLHALFAAILAAPASSIIPPKPLRVAIVGGGIGGAATSYYLQELLTNASMPGGDIVAFERSDYVGGRLKHTFFETSSGETVGVELGGAAWVDGNQYIRALAAALGMNTTTIATTPSTATLASAAANCSGALCALGIWEGTAFAELTSVALRNAGGLARLAAAESKFLHNVKESYTSSAVSAPFRSIAEFLAWGNLSTYTSASIRSFFAARGVKEELIATGLAPLTRAIYNRNCDANTFSLLASLTAELSHHSVRGGNYQLVEALFKHAAAEIRVNTTVSHIQFENKTGRFIVTSSSSSSSSSTSSVVEVRVSEVFDKVVIAAPLERTNISFSGFTLPPGATLDRGFTDWHVTVLEAHSLAPAQFGLNNNNNNNEETSSSSFSSARRVVPKRKMKMDLPRTLPVDLTDCVVLTTANGSTPATPYVCIQPLGKHGGGDHAKSVWLVYSDAALHDAELETLFLGLNVNATLRQHWPYTFAQLTPFGGAEGEGEGEGEERAPQVQPVVLHPSGLINANAMESIASAMEISIIGGRNAARLLLA